MAATITFCVSTGLLLLACFLTRPQSFPFLEAGLTAMAFGLALGGLPRRT